MSTSWSAWPVDDPEARLSHPGGQRAATCIDAALLAVTIALVVMVSLDAHGPVRLLLAVAFTVFVPGWVALAGRGPADFGARMALAGALSLAICTIGASGMVWLHLWKPVQYMGVLAGGSAMVLSRRLLECVLQQLEHPPTTPPRKVDR